MRMRETGQEGTTQTMCCTVSVVTRKSIGNETVEHGHANKRRAMQPPRVTVTSVLWKYVLKARPRSKSTLRNHFETKRFTIIGLGKDTEGFFLTPTIRWNGHKRCFMWSADPAQAKQSMQMCECDRAGTRCVATLAVKYAKRRDSDESFDEAQRSWLCSFFGVLRYLASDRRDIQYFVKNLMREVAHASHGTLARARRAARYLYTNRILHGRFPMRRRHSSSTHSPTATGFRRRRNSRPVLASLSSWEALLSKRVRHRRSPAVKRRLTLHLGSSLQRSVALCRFDHTLTRTLHVSL